jgi:prepilin-type N-terminal cleavage/methylation domain-containing protein
MRSRPLPHPSRDAGLTMVELMVTIVVASLVAASTFVFFAGQQRIYETQTKLVNVQQNVTAAMELLTRFVRSAGSGMFGCVRADSDLPGVGDPGPVNAVGPATPLTAAPAVGARAYLNLIGEVRVPPVWITDGASGAPDTITVAFGDGSFGNWFDAAVGVDMAAGAPTANLDYPATPATLDSVFRVNEFIMVFDTTQSPLRAAPLYNDRGCSIFQITAIDTALNRLTRAATSKWNPASNALAPNLVPFTYTGGASASAGIRHLGTLNWVRFAIRPAAGTTPPALTMLQLHVDPNATPSVLSEGIEDMQISYACDRNPDDGELPYTPTLTDEWGLNHPFGAAGTETQPTNCGVPDAIRITLIARSLGEDPLLSGLTSNAKPGVENGAPGGADRFRHRVVTTTVFPRNN